MPLTLGLPYPLLKRITLARHRRGTRRVAPAQQDPTAYFHRQHGTSARMAKQFMVGIEFKDAVVLDVGAGIGGRAPYWIERGAREVWCIDINREELAIGRDIVAREFPQLGSRIHFVHPDDFDPDQRADLALMVDSFEHLEQPSIVLDQCARQLRPGGRLWIGSIGWYNYMASHCIGHVRVPWCQVLFSEQAIIRTIQTLLRDPAYQPNFWERTEGLDRWDAVKTLRERPGEPLNQLSLRGVRRALRHPEFALEQFTLHPIGAGRTMGALMHPFLKLPVLDELLHGYYTAVLHRNGAAASR